MALRHGASLTCRLDSEGGKYSCILRSAREVNGQGIEWLLPDQAFHAYKAVTLNAVVSCCHDFHINRCTPLRCFFSAAVPKTRCQSTQQFATTVVGLTCVGTCRLRTRWESAKICKRRSRWRTSVGRLLACRPSAWFSVKAPCMQGACTHAAKRIFDQR